jgi:hypothetical protein
MAGRCRAMTSAGLLFALRHHHSPQPFALYPSPQPFAPQRVGLKGEGLGRRAKGCGEGEGRRVGWGLGRQAGVSVKVCRARCRRPNEAKQ